MRVNGSSLKLLQRSDFETIDYLMKALTLTASLLFLFLTGCVTNDTQAGSNSVNMLGIVKQEVASYSATGSNTITISSDELTERKNFSGNKTTLLWGLITLKDY